MPQFHNKRISIMQINEEDWKEEDRYNFKEWLKEFYIDLHFETAKGLEKLYEAMFKRKDRFLVSGINNTGLLQFLKHKTNAEQEIVLQHPVFLIQD
jgi:hypothetical protein